MTRLSYPEYIDAIRRESAQFRDVLADCDPSTAVPSCPDWTAADLLWHLATVQHHWTADVVNRPKHPEQLRYEEPPRPDGHGALMAFFDEATADLVAALAAAEPTEEAWTWSSDQTVGFIIRRQAHEALIHRLDAELAADAVSPLDPALASDGVDEVLDVMFGEQPPWGSWEPLPHLVRVDCTDTGDRVWVQLGLFTGTSPDGTEYAGDEDLHVVDEPGSEPDVVVSGTAGDLDAWLWRRRDGGGIDRRGDRDVCDRFRRCISHPID